MVFIIHLCFLCTILIFYSLLSNHFIFCRLLVFVWIDLLWFVTRFAISSGDFFFSRAAYFIFCVSNSLCSQCRCCCFFLFLLFYGVSLPTVVIRHSHAMVYVSIFSRLFAFTWKHDKTTDNFINNDLLIRVKQYAKWFSLRSPSHSPTLSPFSILIWYSYLPLAFSKSPPPHSSIYI